MHSFNVYTMDGHMFIYTGIGDGDITEAIEIVHFRAIEDGHIIKRIEERYGH